MSIYTQCRYWGISVYSIKKKITKSRGFTQVPIVPGFSKLNSTAMLQGALDPQQYPLEKQKPGIFSSEVTMNMVEAWFKPSSSSSSSCSIIGSLQPLISITKSNSIKQLEMWQFTSIYYIFIKFLEIVKTTHYGDRSGRDWHPWLFVAPPIGADSAGSLSMRCSSVVPSTVPVLGVQEWGQPPVPQSWWPFQLGKWW